MRRPVFLLLSILILASVRAEAITYGTPDGAGHPNVGALLGELFTPGVKDIICTGTLISPTVFLTAAHCTTPLEQEGLDAWVSFDAEITAKSKLYHGTMHTNPAYTFRQDDPGDIAVVVLDRPVRGITPAALPSAGMLDRLFAEGTLLHQRFTAVGYGVHEPVRGGGPPVFPFDGMRWTAVSEYNARSNAWLRLNQVGPAGNGGTCFGDSGGPNFLGAGANETPIIAGLTVTGDLMCQATNVTLRLDSPQARAFLGQFVTLP